MNLFSAAAAAQQQSGAGGAATGAGAGGGMAAFAQLRNSPQFQQLRQVVQEQPQLLQPILQSLGQSNPALLGMINQNQDAFLQMLMGPDEGGEAVEGAEADLGAPPPGTQYIQITPEEDEAITRVSPKMSLFFLIFFAVQLVGLGFERAMVIEAFFACDKNEELAANYLFDNGANGGDW